MDAISAAQEALEAREKFRRMFGEASALQEALRAHENLRRLTGDLSPAQEALRASEIFSRLVGDLAPALRLHENFRRTIGDISPTQVAARALAHPSALTEFAAIHRSLRDLGTDNDLLRQLKRGFKGLAPFEHLAAFSPQAVSAISNYAQRARCC